MPPTDPVDAHQMVSAAVPCAPAIRPNPRNNVALFKIFQNVQYNVVQHKKYVKEMTKLYKKLDQDMFRESFKNALQYLFTFGDTSANVDRVIQFVATFCTSLDEEDEFLMFIFDIIFECQCVSGQSVRYRASQLLAAVLSAMGEEACLDDDLCDKLLASQMQRLQDTRGAVRCRAALALQRLQNPPDDEVTRAYRFHMSCDPSSSVRRAVLMTIAKIRCNVPFVLERLCDVDEAVRRAAFLYMAAMNVTQLRVTQRVHTLKVGLTERSPRVRRVVEEILIPGWLSTFRGNIIDLLKAIRLDNTQDAKDSQYVAGKLLESLFKRLPISELLEWLPTDKTLRLIPADKLNKETAWYWRHLAQHLQAIEDDETLETVLPDLVVLIGYIRAVVESPCPSAKDDPMGFSTRQYVLHELASMLHVYDATDPAGRSGLQTLITDVLTGDYGPLNSDVIRAFVSALELVVPEVSQRMEIISGVITSLRDPPEAEMPPPLPPQPTVDDTKVKLERARLRVSLNVAIEAQEEAVRDQNYGLAAECKAKVEDIQKKLEELQSPAPLPPPSPVHVIREKLSDSDTLNKCLTILNSALDTPQVTSVTPMLQMIFKELEIEIFQNPDILQNAIETIALYAMLDKSFAKENVAFLFTNLIESNETIEATVLRSYVDILCVHGPRVFEETDSLLEDTSARSKRKTNSTEAGDITISDSMALMTPSHTASIEVLLKVLDDNCTTHRQIIVEGLCRLLHLGLLESPSILSRLLILWFNPATADEDLLRQTIGIFFETFPSSVDGAQEQIQKATIPTLRTLANAPSSSPLAEVDHEAVVRFIVSLTRINHELLDSQGGMAEVLSNHLVRRPDAAEVPLACRILSLLSPPREASLASQLAAVLRDASLNLPDKQSCRYLTRYLGALEAAERASLNKMSNTGITDGTLQVEDTITQMGRATNSLPQPLARSTHVVINETVEEEVEIDETSPTEPASTISDVAVEPVEANPERARSSSESEADAPAPAGNESSDSGRGVSPVKKAKVSKGKKKLSLTKRSSENKKSELKRKQAKEKPKEKGVKRTRSQRSLVDVDRGQDQPGTSLDTKSTKETVLDDLDVSNVTVRKSTKGAQPTASQSNAADKPAGKKKGSGKGNGQRNQAKPVTRTSAGSSRSSAGSSLGLMTDDSADETELHTIVYDKEFEQSLLNDSGELADSKQTSKANVTIPETPEGSDESESEPEPEPVKPKGKRNAKKK